MKLSLTAIAMHTAGRRSQYNIAQACALQALQGAKWTAPGVTSSWAEVASSSLRLVVKLANISAVRLSHLIKVLCKSS